LVDRFRAITYVLRQEASVSLGLAGRKLRLAIERSACAITTPSPKSSD
jgi:hypothetical protein